MYRKKIFYIILYFNISTILYAGTWGTIAGKVVGQKDNQPLIGVNIIIEGMDQGAATDRSGKFIIVRIAPGEYSVIASMMGYKKVRQEKVFVYPGLRTDLEFEMEPGVLEGEVVVVKAKRSRLQQDITSTTRFVTESEIEALPIQTFMDIIEIQPGVHEGHFRGGRKSEVIYLVDGMPLQDAIEGEVSGQIPIKAISDITIQTGGFNAEYGNAMSGVVNILTKEGNQKFSSSVELQKEDLLDNPRTFNKGDRSQSSRIESIVEGPLFTSGIYYFTSMNWNNPLSQWKYEEFGERRVIFPNMDSWEYNSVIKLNNRLGSNVRWVISELLSFREWTEYDHRWKLNTEGLPLRRRQSFRTTGSFTHTLSPKIFYYINIGSYYVLKSVVGEATDLMDAYRIDRDSEYWVEEGEYPWWMDHEELQYLVKFGFVSQVTHYHQLKFGVDYTKYDLYKKNLLIREFPTIDPKFRRYVTYNSEYDYSPWEGAIYIQDKMDYEQMVVNVGLRYDQFDPQASRPTLENRLIDDIETWVINQDSTVAASPKEQISPRIGVAFLVGPESEFRINYGHFFQMPVFDYLYTNSNRNSAAGFSPVAMGNPDLEPSKTVAYEIGFKGRWGINHYYDVTIFNKEVTNLIDVGTFVNPSEGSGEIPISGFIEYRNLAYANMWGAEVVITREMSEWYKYEFGYTFMIARGTGSSELSNLQQFSDEIQLKSNSIYPLSWDQRHGFVLTIGLKQDRLGYLVLLYQWDSGFPYTKYTGRSTRPNNRWLIPINRMDIRYNKGISFGPTDLTLYFEVLNLFNSKNNLWADYNGIVGGKWDDPGAWDLRRYIRFGVNWEY